MTIVSVEQAKRLAPDAFGLNGPGEVCEYCGKPYRNLDLPTLVPYGAFKVWTCWPCSVKLVGTIRAFNRLRAERP
jgi:hypothetical protein